MTDRRKVKWLVKFWIAFAVIAVILGYGAFRAKDFAKGPEIVIVEPQNGAPTTSSLIDIKGTAKNISFLTLNGNKIFTDESGAFDEKILLSTGYNIVTLSAQDRFGRTITKTLQLIAKRPREGGDPAY